MCETIIAGGGGGGGGFSRPRFLTIWLTSGCRGHGQKIFDHDHGQNTIFHSQIIHLTMTIGKILGCYWPRSFFTMTGMTMAEVQISLRQNGQPEI